MSTGVANTEELTKFPCMQGHQPKRKRRAVILTARRAILHTIGAVLGENNCVVVDHFDDADFVVIDPFFVDRELFHILDYEMPKAPILLLSDREHENPELRTFHRFLYDTVPLPLRDMEATAREFSVWCMQPKAKCLTHGCDLEFGTGRWLCNLRARELDCPC